MVDRGRRVYVDLGRVPLVHAQRFDFRNVGAQLAVQGCTAHAQEDADLDRVSQCPWGERLPNSRTLQLAHPMHCQSVDVKAGSCTTHLGCGRHSQRTRCFRARS